ncbi:MAG: VWA domain-containing protein [Desulfurococcales archaeon]|nr:VWA domain-containing protein [Desulfurococcales archaeon]
MKREPLDLVVSLDISVSMNKSYSDMTPSKLAASKEAILLISGRLLEYKHNRLGLVAFYGQSIPLLPLTNNRQKLIDTLYKLTFTGEGSAPGDGIAEAVKLLRQSRPGRRKQVIMITDGEINQGAPLEAAALYARNMDVRVDIIIIGDKPRRMEAFMSAAKITGGTYAQVGAKNQLFSRVIEVIR